MSEKRKSDASRDFPVPEAAPMPPFDYQSNEAGTYALTFGAETGKPNPQDQETVRKALQNLCVA